MKRESFHIFKDVFMKQLIALVAIALAVPAMADTFKCTNDTDTSNARWQARVSYETLPDAGRVPGFLLVHSAHKDGSIVATTDRRRISVGGQGEAGTSYSLLLNKKEKKLLLERADGRLNLKAATRVTVWIDFETNQEQHDGQKPVAGKISYSDADGKEIYSTDLSCDYKE